MILFLYFHSAEFFFSIIKIFCRLINLNSLTKTLWSLDRSLFSSWRSQTLFYRQIKYKNNQSIKLLMVRLLKLIPLEPSFQQRVLSLLKNWMNKQLHQSVTEWLLTINMTSVTEFIIHLYITDDNVLLLLLMTSQSGRGVKAGLRASYSRWTATSTISLRESSSVQVTAWGSEVRGQRSGHR